ncbi:MAG TPA: biotin transporter BioY [Flavobacteriales bacterium]|jgi:biotin transport system substrate-specific component
MLNKYMRLHQDATTDFILKLLVSIALLMLLAPMVLDVKGIVPITLQSLMVLFGAIAFGWKTGLIAVVVYIAAGAAGVPVFAGYTSGVNAVFGPFGGFFFGFLAAAIISGYLAELERFQKAIPAMMVWILGHGIILLLGVLWMSRFDPDGWYEKLKMMVPGAIVKSLIGALIIQLIIKFYTRDGKRAFED